ncbi:Armadillo repeat-containing protein 8 [Chytridiales sp. JEL 0842]|nr:Armadillo repeat-containing protein 8 [Chytridiales sp. JEL 0842]
MSRFDQTKHRAAVDALLRGDAAAPDEKLAALRFIKNSIIGNKTKKDLYITLGVLDGLLRCLSDTMADNRLKIESAVIIGSLAHGLDEHLIKLKQAGVVWPLFQCLSSGDMQLIEYSAKALKSLFQRGAGDSEIQPAFVVTIVTILSESSKSVAQQTAHTATLNVMETCAAIIAKTAISLRTQALFFEAGAINCLANFLDVFWSQQPRLQEATLDALAALCKDNADIATSLVATRVGTETVIGALQRFLKSTIGSLRLQSATCLTYLSRLNLIPADTHNSILSSILPTLIRFFSEPIQSVDGTVDLQDKVFLVFAELVSGNEELQKAAMEGDAIVKLGSIISKNINVASASTTETKKGVIPLPTPKKDVEKEPLVGGNGVLIQPNTAKVTEAALLAVAAVSSLKEDCRKQVIDTKILRHIVEAMSCPLTPLRAAACQCTRSLSRSVKNLRTSLVDAGIAAPLCKLLSDPDINVQITASATLCNIVLDFSPMKSIAMENGAVEKLITLVDSSNSTLRLNSVWALKNLLFQAESEIKHTVMGMFGWGKLARLVDDPEISIQEQSLNLIRNLACGKESDIDFVFKGIGEQSIISMLQSKLSPASSDGVVLQALYIIVNISTGNISHKSIIINSDFILQRILNYMSHFKSLIRLACVWTLINLTEKDEAGYAERAQTLRHYGFEETLRSMHDDLDMDVKDRVKTAVGNFAV